MKKKMILVFSAILLLCMVFSTNFLAESSRTETIALKKSCEWNIRGALTRSGVYYTVFAECYAVYPTDHSQDNFQNIKVKASTAYGALLTDIYVLSETDTDGVTMQIMDGMIQHKTIHFAFSGNNPEYAAEARVYYDAK